jgi:hypothetical protein
MKRTILTVLSLCLFAQLVWGAVPQTLSYQGVLRDADGDLVADANYSLTFQLYAAPTGGTALWTETQSVATSKGIFNAILGSTTSLSSVSFSQQLYLGIAVDGESEMSPRVQFTSSPYSLATSLPKVAIMRDVKENIGDGGGGNSAGDFVNGAWRTRELNVLDDYDGMGIQLVSNQFSLPAGTYEIEAFCPAASVDSHQSRLRNITDGETTLLGTNERCGGGTTIQTWSKIMGRFSIASQKDYEIQHQCQTTRLIYGLGYYHGALWSEEEVYTLVKITKLR